MGSSILDWLDGVHAGLHRRRWWIRLALAVVLVPWFGRFAYLRMTTLPADPGWRDREAARWFQEPTLPEGPTKVLLETIVGVKKPPTLSVPTTAPAGKQWQAVGYAKNCTGQIEFNLFAALEGAWLPQERYRQGHIAAYIQSPEVEASLERMAALAGEPMRLDLPDYSHYGAFRTACKLLAVHARACMAGRGDVATATRDMRAVLALSSKLQDPGVFINHLVAFACRAVVFEEVRCWSREFRFSRAEARGLMDMLAAYRLDMPRVWNEAVEAEGTYTLSCLDGYYTKGPDGNGWYVIHPRTTGDRADTVASAANVLSVFLADRQTIVRKHEAAVRRARLEGDLAYPEALRRLTQRAKQGSGEQKQVNPADGEALLPEGYAHGQVYTFFARDVADHAAAVISLAISAYHTEHGAYPGKLEDLVPEYIDSIPIDPASGKAMRYRRDERDGYSLYGVGGNGVDDGGAIRDEKGEVSSARWDAADWVYPGIRNEMYDEWVLVEAGNAAGSGNGQ